MIYACIYVQLRFNYFKYLITHGIKEILSYLSNF